MVFNYRQRGGWQVTLYEKLQNYAARPRPIGRPVPKRTEDRPKSLDPLKPFPDYDEKFEGATQTIPIADSERARQQLQQELDTEENKRKKGRLSTIITGSTGLLDEASIARRTLLGF
jgi:hypothetical protein